MITHRSFTRRHFLNFIGGSAIRGLEELRLEAERFIEKQVDKDAIINITETSDAYASTVTVWYRTK